MSLRNPVEIAPGCHIVLHLSLSVPEGQEAFTTFGHDPLACTVGDGTLRPGMELALYGLKSGDSQTLTLEPEQAFGFRDSQLVSRLDRRLFPDPQILHEGHIFSFALPSGQMTMGRILELDESEVTVDFNHPLAGFPIVFQVEILEVAPATLQ